ncbi:hypothetical protein HanIR_Chr12g0579721 [Helianthus annuus]|nr:hypothetical protein HanIR_Chr12g0579721 [Helianthus annuus]
MFPTSGCTTLASLRYADLISIVSAPICIPSTSYSEEGRADLAVVLDVAKVAEIGGELG